MRRNQKLVVGLVGFLGSLPCGCSDNPSSTTAPPSTATSTGTDTSTATSGNSQTCSGTALQCAEAWNGNECGFLTAYTECVGGIWRCPSGTVFPGDCCPKWPLLCYEPCRQNGVEPTCRGNQWVCPAGTSQTSQECPGTPGTPSDGIVEILASEQRPSAIALDSTSVYWTNWTDNDYDGTVMKVSIAGGAPVALASGLRFANGIAVDGSGVYFAGGMNADGGGGLFKVGLDGGTTKHLASSGFCNDPFAIGPAGIYGTGNDDGGRTIMRVPLDGGAATPVVSSSTLVQTAESYGIAVDAASVYWTFSGSPTTVRKAPLGGGQPVTLATVSGPGFGIAVDAKHAYFGTSSAVMKVPIDGGPVTTLADAAGHGIALDEKYVYFTDLSSTVKKVPKDGGTVTTLATNLSAPWPIAVDSKSVYWGNQGSSGTANGSVMKLTPK